MSRHFIFEGTVILARIRSLSICTNAQFVLDKPVILEPDEVVTLTNGAFYIDDHKIEGRWTDLRYQKEKTNE